MSVATFANPQKAGSVRLQWRHGRPEAMVIGLFVSITAALAIAGAGGALRLMYPSLAVLTALFLFFRSKPAYVSFVIWIWFISAFVRRLADFRSGFQETSLILLAPYLVTAVSGLLILMKPRALAEKRNRPIILALVAVVYGFCVGLLKFSVVQMAPALLNWVVPLCFAHLLVECRVEFQQIRNSIQRSCMYGAVIMGAYAIYQFFLLPPWDRLWLENMRTTTFGVAEPMQLRGFSTMNAPVVFGLTMMAVLLLVLGSTRKLRFAAGSLGLAGLLLALNRSAWLGFGAGVLFILTRLPNRDRVRIIAALLLFVAAGSVVFVLPEASEIVNQKFGTLSSPNQDTSYQARVEGYGNAFSSLLREPFGEGVGSPDIEHKTSENDDAIGPHDSVVLELLYSLGWFGTLCYAYGIGLVLVQMFQNRSGLDRFGFSVQSALLAFMAQSLLNDIVYGGVGVFFWIAAGLQIAGAETTSLERQAASQPLYSY